MRGKWVFHGLSITEMDTLGDIIFSYQHPILSMLSMPIIVFMLFWSLILSVYAVGRHGIIPGIALLLCLFVMHLFYSKTSNTILFVWIQPFICYAEYICIKYAFASKDEPGAGVIAMFVFAAVTLVLLYYTGTYLEIGVWGVYYIIPFGAAWVLSITRPTRVYYIIVYLLLYALVMSFIVVLKRKKEKDSYSDVLWLKIWPGIIILIITALACIQPMFDELLTAQNIEELRIVANDSNSHAIVRGFASVVNFLIEFPVTHAIGSIIKELAEILSKYG